MKIMKYHGKQIIEHRARLTGLQIEHQLIVQLIGVHRFQSLDEIGGLEQFIGKRNDTRATMIGEEDKDVVIRPTVKHLACGTRLQSRRLASENFEEIGGGDISTSVVLADTSIDILAVGPVDNDTLGWVVNVLSNVVEHHHNDAVGKERRKR